MQIQKELEKTFLRIDTRFNEETLKDFMLTPIDDVLEKYILLASWINMILLKPKSRILKAYIEAGITNKELIADTILIEYYKHKTNTTDGKVLPYRIYHPLWKNKTKIEKIGEKSLLSISTAVQ